MAEFNFLQGTNELLLSSWGRIRLFAAEVRTDASRTQVVHDLAFGDIHPVQDKGRRIRRTTMKLQFDDFPGAPSPLEAALALEAAVASGETAMLSHPLLGRYVASVAEFSWEIDEHSVISATAEFLQEEADVAVTPTGAASSGTSGESSVAQSAEQLDRDLVDVNLLKMSGPTAQRLLSTAPSGSSLGLSLSPSLSLSLSPSVNMSVEINATISASVAANFAAKLNAEAAAKASASGRASATASAIATATIGSGTSPSAPSDASAALSAAAFAEASQGLFAATTVDARVAVSKWSTGEVPTREIMVDAARISNNIALMIEIAGLERDLALWPAFRSAIMLGESVRSAAIAATSETPSVFVMRVLQSTALLPLAARVYGGAAAPDRARQISNLNDISTPGWLTPGDYLMPTRTDRRSAL